MLYTVQQYIVQRPFQHSNHTILFFYPPHREREKMACECEVGDVFLDIAVPNSSDFLIAAAKG
jgi:hypothetical protein